MFIGTQSVASDRPDRLCSGRISEKAIIYRQKNHKERKRDVKTLLKYWILIAIIVTGLAWIPYVLVQQDLRLSANDPQIQLAEDLALQLANGQAPQSLLPTTQVDIARSLATYVIIFDNTGTPLASSAQLNGQTPQLPGGIFDYVRQNGEDRITWQPQTGLRNAIVVTRYSGVSSGFVMVGRSLREIEKRIDGIQELTLFAWLSILLVSLLSSAFLLRQPRPYSTRSTAA
jgi:hypothetical protein